MARFPKREPDIARLAHDVATGLAANAEAFPSPPVAAETLMEHLAAYNAKREEAIVASAASISGTQAKDEALATLVDAVKTNLRYAENAARGDEGKLQLLGWGGRRTPTANDVPGQVRTLEVIREGNNWVFLDWKQPSDGGLIAAYKVQRRKREGGGWVDVGTAVESEIMLTDQEPGVEFEYHVIALNRSGEGPPSNIVRAVL